MKDRKHAEASDVLLYEIISKKCGQLLTNCSSSKTRQLMQINQTIKLSSNFIKSTKTTKTIVSKKKIVYSNIIAQSTLREMALEQTEQLRRKEEELLAQLMRHIIQNIKLKLEKVIDKISIPSNNKLIFRCITDVLQQQFDLINEELTRIRKQSRIKQIRDVICFEIESVSSDQFIEMVFSSIPSLKDFYTKFDIQTFTNQQLQDLKQYQIIEDLINLQQILEKRMQQKRIKKRNKKKKNKNKVEAADSTTQGQEIMQKNESSEKENDSEIIQYLQSLVVNENRIGCYVSDNWMQRLSQKYAIK